MSPAPRALALAALLAPCGGCFFLSARVAAAGLRREVPVGVNTLRGPVVEAWGDEGPGRLAVRYRVRVAELRRGGPDGRGQCGPEVVVRDRWLSISRGRILAELDRPDATVERRREGALNVFALSRAFVAAASGSRPAWRPEALTPLEVRPAEAAAAPPAGTLAVEFVGPEARYPRWSRSDEAEVLLRAAMDFPETDGPDEVEFPLPGRDYRTLWGCAAQGLLALSVPADLAVLPFQGLARAWSLLW